MLRPLAFNWLLAGTLSANETFDLVYSWGVIHHSPDTIRALEEILRVARVGGKIKIMVYHRRSLVALYKYLQFNLLRGKPFKSISWAIYHHQESIGTKAFTIREVKNILSKYPVCVKDIRAWVTNYDLLWNKPFLFRLGAYILAYAIDRSHMPAGPVVGNIDLVGNWVYGHIGRLGKHTQRSPICWITRWVCAYRVA